MCMMGEEAMERPLNQVDVGGSPPSCGVGMSLLEGCGIVVRLVYVGAKCE